MNPLPRKFLSTSLLLISVFLPTILVHAEDGASRLDEILERGYIRVGTTGDFKPFTYLNPNTEAYEGIDIDAAKDMAEALGVELRWVKTTWPTLVEGLLEDRYDIAVGGITRTLQRQMVVGITDPYFEVGKCPLVRDEDAKKLTTIDNLNQPEVRVGVNPGGTNERFVRQFLPNATVTVVPDNLSIPGKVLAGEFDLMITDNAEAMLFASQMTGLEAVNPDSPFTHDDFGYLITRDDASFLNWLNLWIHQAKAKGSFEKWQQRWLK